MHCAYRSSGSMFILQLWSSIQVHPSPSVGMNLSILLASTYTCTSSNLCLSIPILSNELKFIIGGMQLGFLHASMFLPLANLICPASIPIHMPHSCQMYQINYNSRYRKWWPAARPHLTYGWYYSAAGLSCACTDCTRKKSGISKYQCCRYYGTWPKINPTTRWSDVWD